MMNISQVRPVSHATGGGDGEKKTGKGIRTAMEAAEAKENW